MEALIWEEPNGLRVEQDQETIAVTIRESRGKTVWWDVTDPGRAELALLESLGFHPLTLEDLEHYTPVPKVEQYEGYHFIVTHALGYDFETQRVEAPEIHLYVGTNYVISVHEGPCPPLDEARRRCRQHPAAILGRGVAFVLHAILDAIIDQYLPLADAWAERIDRLETSIDPELAFPHDPRHRRGRPDHPDCPPGATTTTRRLLTRISRSRRALSQLRRRIVQQRMLVETLLNEDAPLLNRWVRPYYRDLLDHLQRAEDMLETTRERLNSVMELYVSVQNLLLAELSTSMNRTMERLTGVATLIMPLTLITGIYGMNFHHMPELHWRWGYYAVLFIMLGLGLGIYGYMRRRGWV